MTNIQGGPTEENDSFSLIDSYSLGIVFITIIIGLATK